MFNKQDSKNDLFGDDVQSLVRQLEQNTFDKIQKSRSQERIEMRVKVVLRPGSMSQRDSWSLDGVTGDISRSGAKILLPRPIHVADIFHVAFDPQVLPVAPQLCIAQWCRVVRSDAYECGLSFFQPIDLEGAIHDGSV